MDTKYQGAYIPQRSERDEKKDTDFSELTFSSAPNWIEKTKWLTYKERNQTRTNTCMAQTIAKLIEKNYPDKVFSASPIYNSRRNKLDPNNPKGMWLNDALDIACNKNKVTFESRIKSQFLKSDAQIETEALKWNEQDDKISQEYKPEKYGFVLSKNIDEIASVLESGQGVAIVVYATHEEWSQKFPKPITPNLQIQDATVLHGIAGVDYGLINGVKYIKIEDSAHFGGISERWLDQEFINKRTHGIGFVVELSQQSEVNKPTHIFNVNLTYGMRKNPEVVHLQDALKYFGFMDKDVPSTGNFLGETFRAVIRFQEHYKAEILTPLGYTSGTGNFHRATRTHMNKLITDDQAK